MAPGHSPCGVGVTLCGTLGYDEVALSGHSPVGLGPVPQVMVLLGFPFCPKVATAPTKASLSCGGRVGDPAGVAAERDHCYAGGGQVSPLGEATHTL